jgi:hypothetical protein
MASALTPRERAITALYGPHCNLAFIQPGAITEAVESAIIAAVAAERERCAAAVMRILSAEAAAPILQEICAVPPAGAAMPSDAARVRRGKRNAERC